MSDERVDRLRDRVGESMDTVSGFDVEAGKVVEFATALGDDHSVFRDASAASERGLDRIPAPITFPWLHMFPHHRPPGVDHLGFDLGLDDRFLVHGEQAYEYERPVFVGDTLAGTTTLSDVTERRGDRAGSMIFVTFETAFRDESDDLVVTERTTAIETGGAVDESAEESVTRTPPDTTSRPGFSTATLDGADPAERLGPDALEPGDSATLTVADLTRGDYVRYAGASGDFNPIHYDVPYARGVGNPDVFGQGMLAAGYAGTLLSAWVGVDAITAFEVRFTSQSWPGDTLTVDGTVESVTETATDIAFEVTRQTGETVVRGSATADLADR